MTYSAMYGGRSGRAKGKAPKSKKLKCILCHAKGHDTSTCPYKEKQEEVIKINTMKPTLGFGKTHKTSRKAGSIAVVGSTNSKGGDDHLNENNGDSLITTIMDMFLQDETKPITKSTTTTSLLTKNKKNKNTDIDHTYEPIPLIDGSCDIGATIDTIATTITNSNMKKAKITYQNTIQQYNTIYGACICRYTIKLPVLNHNTSSSGSTTDSSIYDLNNDSRITNILETDPNTYFVIGLGPGFFLNDIYNNNDSNNSDRNTKDKNSTSLDNNHHETEDYKIAVHTLSEMIRYNHNTTTDDNHVGDSSTTTTIQNRIVGLYGKLDYSLENMDMIGYERCIQIQKLRATCTVAIQYQIPIQIQLLPSVPISTSSSSSTTTIDENDITDEYTMECMNAYKQVIKDFAKLLLEMTSTTSSSTTDNNAINDTNNTLRVHISCWNGTENHMNHLLQAFPDHLYIGVNASIGYSKNKHLHNCIFSLPLHRCIIESDAPNAIPTIVSQQQNIKKVFCHPGCIVYTAQTVVEHKQSIMDQLTPMDVIRISTQNILHLYGQQPQPQQQQNDDTPTTNNNNIDNKDDNDNNIESIRRNQFAQRIEYVKTETLKRRRELLLQQKEQQQQQQDDDDDEEDNDELEDENDNNNSIDDDAILAALAAEMMK